jgi:hypothetical protein
MNRRQTFALLFAIVVNSKFDAAAGLPPGSAKADDILAQLRELLRATEAENYNAAPSALRQGCYLDVAV